MRCSKAFNCRASSVFEASSQHFAQLHEGVHRVYAHLHRAQRVQKGRHHQRPILGERQRGGELELGEVVAIGDHLIHLGLGKLKHEVVRKALAIAAHLFVKQLKVAVMMAPRSVKASGSLRRPPQLEVANCDFKSANFSAGNSKIKSAGNRL